MKVNENFHFCLIDYQNWYSEEDITQYISTGLFAGLAVFNDYILMKFCVIIKIIGGRFVVLNKKVIRRNYSDSIKFKYNGFDDDWDLSKGHPHHIITICDVKIKEENLFMDSIFLYKDYNKVDCREKIDNYLNTSVSKVEDKLNLWEKKENITKNEKNLILGEKKIINRQINMEKGKEIKIVGIQNLTTSNKNGSKIIGEGVLKSYPESKGINIYNKDCLLFLLQGREEYRRILWYLMLSYRYDIKNQENLKLYKEKLDMVAEQEMSKFMEKEGLEEINFIRLKEKKEFDNDKEAIFGYLLEEFKSEEW